jgi:hypothetical protein
MRVMVLSEKKTIKMKGHNLCWMRYSLLASVDVIEFQTTDAYSILDLSNAMCNLRIRCKDEKLKVMLRTIPNSLTH